MHQFVEWTRCLDSEVLLTSDLSPSLITARSLTPQETVRNLHSQKKRQKLKKKKKLILEPHHRFQLCHKTTCFALYVGFSPPLWLKSSGTVGWGWVSMWVCLGVFFHCVKDVNILSPGGQVRTYVHMMHLHRVYIQVCVKIPTATLA